MTILYGGPPVQAPSEIAEARALGYQQGQTDLERPVWPPTFVRAEIAAFCAGFARARIERARARRLAREALRRTP